MINWYNKLSMWYSCGNKWYFEDFAGNTLYRWPLFIKEVRFWLSL